MDNRPATASAGPASAPDTYAARPLGAARRLLHVRRAFGEPIERDGVTLVPVARVVGATGFGGGDGTMDEDATMPARSGSGGGGGLGVRVTPVGVYVVTGADVRWEPAFDLTWVVIGGQVLGAIAVLALTRMLRRYRRRR